MDKKKINKVFNQKLIKKGVYILDRYGESLSRLEWILKSFNDFEIYGMFNKCEDLLDKYRSRGADIIFMELDMPIRDALRTVRRIKASGKDPNIVMYTQIDDPQFVYASFEYGVKGFILKNADLSETIFQIKNLSMNRVAISSDISKILIKSFYLNLESPLSCRELEVMSELAKGKTTTQISKDLKISGYTAKAHIRNIYRKLEINNKADAISIASANRWI